MPAFFIEIEDGAGTKIGPGPIYTVQSWSSTERRDRAGSFSFIVPAQDQRASIATKRRIARCYADINEVLVEIGAGVIDKWSYRIEGTKAMLEISGSTLLHALTYRTVSGLAVGTASTSVVTGPADIMGLAQTGWSLDTTTGYNETAKSVYVQYAGETVLEAFVKLVEITGEHFRMGQTTGGDFKLVWLKNDLTDSGLRAIQTADSLAVETNDDVCIIRSLEYVEDTFSGYVGRVYAFGGGDPAVNLSGASTAYSGYTIGNDATKGDYLEHTATWNAYGVDLYMTWNEVTAQEMLVEVAYEWLKRHIDQAKTYRLRVDKLEKLIYPGQTIRVIYRGWTGTYQWINIDTDLTILEVTMEASAAGGVRVGEILVCDSTVADRYPEDDNTALLDAINGR